MIALPWAKIVDIAVFKFNSVLSFTKKAPLKDARAHVHDAPHHFVSFTRNAWTHTHTHTQTHKHQPPNFFSPTHRRKSSFIRTCYAKALAPFILYDFGLEAGTA